MSENIFYAYDLSTDQSVRMSTMSRDGYFTVEIGSSYCRYDDLATAAYAVSHLVTLLEDNGAPTPLQALTAIAEWFGPDSGVEVEDHGDGPFIVNYADMDDDDD